MTMHFVSQYEIWNLDPKSLTSVIVATLKGMTIVQTSWQTNSESVPCKARIRSLESAAILNGGKCLILLASTTLAPYSNSNG